MKTYTLFFLAFPTLAVVGCGGSPSASPTEIVKAYIAATRNKDAEAVRRVLTQNSLKMLETGASQSGMTVDEFIRGGKAAPNLEVNEYRNEEIEGDTASVEANYGGEWQKIFLVKEDGQWKIAFDRG